MKRIVCILVACAITTSVWPQARDSVRVYPLPEFVVTATRSPILLQDSPSPIDVITDRDIERSNGVTVADALRSANSIFLNEYGAQGALKTVSLRGTSSQHLLVLVDGNRYNMFQNGLVDFSLLPLNDVERIEVVRGGSSALYGADALGGVVNIITRQPASPLRIRTGVATGSFGYQQYRMEAQGRFGQAGFIGGAMTERGRDDYPFVVPRTTGGDTAIRRDNADFQRQQWFVRNSTELDGKSTVSFSVQHVTADRGAAGPFFGPGTGGSARQSDKDVNMLAEYIDSHIDNLELETHAGFHYSLERYADPNPFFPLDSYYKNRFVNVNPVARITVGPSDRLVLGIEYAQGVLDGNDFDSRVMRVQKSFFASNESRYEFDRNVFDRILLFQTIRYDNISDVGYAVMPKVGINVRVLKDSDLRLRTSLGQSFRSPTFNDLYYRGFSNPGLKPERSTGFDAGVMAEVSLGGRQSVEASYFHLDTENRILFDLATFAPVNIGRAVSRGLEAKYEGRFLNDLVQIGVRYTYTDARKRNQSSPTDSTFNQQLVFVPKHLATFRVSFARGPLSLNIVHNVVGSRYTNEDNSAQLDPYRLTDVNAVLNIPAGSITLSGKLEVSNVFDYDYEVLPFYPMPRRSFRVSIAAEY